MIDHPYLESLIDYLTRSVSAYHACARAVVLLEQAGFRRLDEADEWKLEAGGAYYVERNGSSVVAFIVGAGEPAREGFRIAGAHTDSPALRVRASTAAFQRNVGRVGVEVYGSPIISGWLDRELALAGRLAVVDTAGRARSVLVDTMRPVALVPNAAIHLNRAANTGYEYDPQAKLGAVFAALPESSSKGFLPLLAEAAGLDAGDIAAADLFLYDPTPPRRYGADGELVASGRVDNLAGVHAALSALIESRSREASVPATRAAAFFDNEEIGSMSYQGADSAFLRSILERVAVLRGAGSASQAYWRAAARSFLVSVDATHAFLPSWAEKFDERTTPSMNGGGAIKINGKLRYASDAEGTAWFEALCARVGAPFQRFEFRADQTPGSTIGPMSSAALGIRTLDVGLPIFAMHSIRESFGAADQASMATALEGYYSGR